MKLKALLGVAFLFASLQVYSLARAEGRNEGHEGGHEGHAEGRPLPPRAAPPKFQPHPQGVHPHGPMVRPHQVRVLAPRVIGYGGHQWRHWEHPEFARPAYYWDWGGIHHVSCVAEDSYGDQYPVTEATFAGFGLANMTSVEDDALDSCNAESGGDQSCYLATCSHF
jgi:hypothetical protein